MILLWRLRWFWLVAATAVIPASLFAADLTIHSGELHATRIPREHWSHRLQMAKALGLTTVSTYVFWGRHEPESGKFDWSGENDLAEFCRQAQREGLQVLLRPGPYVCGEYDLGGMPWWLLKDRKGITERVELNDGRGPRKLPDAEMFAMPLSTALRARLKIERAATSVADAVTRLTLAGDDGPLLTSAATASSLNGATGTGRHLPGDCRGACAAGG